MSEINRIEFGAAELRDVAKSLGREWLLTNGLGGYASASLLGANTRRYHGLLVAAEKPPVQRTVLLSKVDEEITVQGVTYELGVNEWQDGTISPQGQQYLERFTYDGTSVEFRYALPDGYLTKTVCMAQGVNTVYLNYRYEGAQTARLVIFPLLCSKDMHSQQRCEAGQVWQSSETGGVFRMWADETKPPVSMCGSQAGQWQAEPQDHWYLNYYHRAEAERGLDYTEDLYLAHRFSVNLAPGEAATMVWWLGQPQANNNPELNFAKVRAGLQARMQQLIAAGGFTAQNETSRLLFMAADQFVVGRPSVRSVLPSGVPDRSAIAGYHWFTDWGRDTMIAFPGLLLTTGRYSEAAGLLRTFAAYLDQGMLPNRFPDNGEEPEYNTVDATLWLFQAVHAYFQATADLNLIAELYPKLLEVLEWHRRGTRYGIRCDQQDGLLQAGEPGVQLSWMDVKIGDRVVTPRSGKPVEINALWCNALGVMHHLAIALKKPAAEGSAFAEAARLVQQTFQAKFWYAEQGYLYDVIDSNDPPNQYIDAARRDFSLRPNQLFALSLPFGPFVLLDEATKVRAVAVLEVCAQNLLTAYGLRTLSPDDLRYHSRFTGDQLRRDEAYHQGTIWPWLIGPFVEAHYRIYQDKKAARAFLEPLIAQLREGSIGSLNEVYDADAPHRPLGCIAQAWSVSEVLRLWVLLQ